MSDSKTVTIKQVAQAAGVSTQTVSRVLNHRPDVAAATRTRVQEIIDQLHYQPNAAARSLKQRSRTLGVVAAELHHYGPMRRLAGIDAAARELGYALHLRLLPQLDETLGQQTINELLAWQVEGILWAVPEISHNRDWLATKIRQIPVPLVMISEQTNGPATAASVNNRAGARLATEHLLAQGYRHIGFISGPLTWDVACQRYKGWQDALPGASDDWTVEGNWSAASGLAGLQSLCTRFSTLDAVFAGNDQMALGALQAAHKMGLRVPQDLGVVGFDNIPEAAFYWPPLTTVRHQIYEQGEIAARTLIRLIEEQYITGEIAEPEVEELQPQLIVRESSLRRQASPHE